MFLCVDDEELERELAALMGEASPETPKVPTVSGWFCFCELAVGFLSDLRCFLSVLYMCECLCVLMCLGGNWRN